MKYPDTRNQLDNNKEVNKKTKKAVKLGFETFKENYKKVQREEVSSQSPVKLKSAKKPSKGSIFKAQHGYSKSVKRSMRKAGILSQFETDTMKLSQYREGMRTKRKAQTKARQEKHSKSVAFKRANGKKGKGKQAITVPKKEKKK